MPSSIRNPRNLADWIELDYFHRPRTLRRLWWPAIAVALLLSGGYLAWAFAGRHTAFQAGPVSPAHALFGDDCSQCHTGRFQTFARLWHGDPARRSVPDDACLKCHRGDAHHAAEVGAAGCADCHKEHRGRHLLARVDDAHCTRCHADLKRGDGKEPDYDPHVTAFAPGAHPDFRLWARAEGEPADAGTIRFNHKVHLDPERVLTIDDKQLEMQEAQAKKQGARPGFDVGREQKQRRKLKCQDCHQPDPSGRYMQPIRYEQHCKGCHPLAVQLVGDWGGGRQALARAFGKTPAPHPSPHRTAEVVRGALRDRLARFIAEPANRKAFLDLGAPPEPSRPVPGSRRSPPLAREEYAWVNHQQAEVERLLFDGAGGCRFCHQEKTDPERRPGGLPKFKPSDIRERWNDHALFSHKSHRMLDCAACHPASASDSAAQVLLPRVGACMECHRPRGGGARGDCVECHLYHDPPKRYRDRYRDDPRTDPPARRRLSIEEATGR
jgi:hypothetical protein